MVIPANQFDVVYKIINDFNYRGNGTFVVSARGGDAITELPRVPTERGRTPVYINVHTHGVHPRGDAGLISSGYPEAMGFITVSFVMDRKTFDSPRASCLITGSLLIKQPP